MICSVNHFAHANICHHPFVNMYSSIFCGQRLFTLVYFHYFLVKSFGSLIINCLGYLMTTNFHFQISDAKITITDTKPGAIETVIIIAGTPEQTHAAQSLIQAFVMSEKEST